jgi:hypothetical protein
LSAAQGVNTFPSNTHNEEVAQIATLNFTEFFDVGNCICKEILHNVLRIMAVVHDPVCFSQKQLVMLIIQTDQKCAIIF